MSTWKDDDIQRETVRSKQGMNWLPIIIIVATIILLLIIGLIVQVLRKRAANRSYNPAAISEQGAATTTRA
jgi:putative effector of murein hydrolase LrgA (UPF0299 family)